MGVSNGITYVFTGVNTFYFNKLNLGVAKLGLVFLKACLEVKSTL